MSLLHKAAEICLESECASPADPSHRGRRRSDKQHRAPNRGVDPAILLLVTNTCASSCLSDCWAGEDAPPSASAPVLLPVFVGLVFKPPEKTAAPLLGENNPKPTCTCCLVSSQSWTHPLWLFAQKSQTHRKKEGRFLTYPSMAQLSFLNLLR